MKAILAVVAVFAVTLGLVSPAFSQTTPFSDTVNTSVTISTGGNIPVVKAKWEQDRTPSLEDGDILHRLAGSQFNPPCVFQANKTIDYFAVVTDAEDMGDVQQVAADVWHPLNSWELGSFKYQIPFTKITNNTVAKEQFLAAVAAGLVTFNSPYTVAEIVTELDKGTARIWMGSADLYYEQPAGNYLVSVTAYDFNSNPSIPFNNTFLYVPVSCFAVDNNAVNYGNVSISKNKTVAGDTKFLLGDGLLTVRNLGNTNLQLTSNQSDMGFGKSLLEWNVEFDGRIGHLVTAVVYQPFTLTTLPGVLQHSSDDEVDLSIHVKKGTGIHTGTLTLGSVIAP